MTVFAVATSAAPKVMKSAITFERFEVIRKNRIAHARALSQRYELGVVYRCKHGCDLEANGGVNDGVELRGRSFHIEHVALPEPNSERYAACHRKLGRTTIGTNSAPPANGAQAICCVIISRRLAKKIDSMAADNYLGGSTTTILAG